MSGTVAGGQKAAAKNLENNPNFYSEIGKVGGSKTGVKKGFAANPELARIAGSKCGRIGKRGYTFIRETETFMEYSDNNKPGEKVKFYK